jgi:hypothetical protein
LMGFMIFQSKKQAVSGELTRRRLKTGAQPERAAPHPEW